MKLHKGILTAVMGLMVLTSSCSGDNTAAPAPTATEAPIGADPTPALEPTPTDVPAGTSTATPEPTDVPAGTSTAAPEPTATPTADERDAAVIAAWERYLELSFGSRGKDPTPEQLDYDSYVAEEAKEALMAIRDQQLDEGWYIEGLVTSLDPSINYNPDGDARVSDCLGVELAAFFIADDSPDGDPERRQRTADARLSPVDGDWVLVALQTGDECDV